MLAREGPLELAHQGGGLLGDGTHLLGPIPTHVQNGPNMQRAHRGVGIPGALGAVTSKDLREAGRVVRQVFQWHRAVFNEGHRLAVAPQGHHDVEARLADLPKSRLPLGVSHGDHRAGQPQVSHEFLQGQEVSAKPLEVLTSKLHQQEGIGLTPAHVHQGILNYGSKNRVHAAKLNHGAVHQFNRHRLEPHNRWGHLHRLLEGRKVHNAQHLGPGNGRECQPDGLKRGQGALRSHQQMGQIDAAVGGVGPLTLGIEDVKVVAAHAAHHLGPEGPNLGRDLLCNLMEPGDERPKPLAVQLHLGAIAEGRKPGQGAVVQDGVDRPHVVHHVAVVQRARAAGVIARHAANRALCGCGDIHRKPDTVWLERLIEVIQNHAGLHRHLACLQVQGEHFSQVSAGVDDQCLTHGLSTLRRAATATEDRHAGIAGDLQGQAKVEAGLRHHHPQRHALVDGGIGRIAAPGGSIEEDFASHLFAESIGEPAPTHSTGRAPLKHHPSGRFFERRRGMSGLHGGVTEDDRFMSERLQC